MDSRTDFWIMLELFGSSYCQQLRQKSMRKSMPNKSRIQAQMFETYAKINWKSMEIQWKTREKSVILRDLQNLDFCDMSAVKTWFSMYLDDKKSVESHENLTENQFSKKLRKHILNI